MAASYSIITTSITETSVQIRIIPDKNYRYYRIFVRLYSDSSDSTYDRMFTIVSTTTKTISGLTPGTRYAINVGYTDDNSSDSVVGWIGSNSFYTLDEDTNYYVKIRYDANGGSGAPSTHTETGTSSSVSVTLSSIEPTREGYVFLGWSRSSSATSPSYYPGRTYKFSSVTMGSTTSYTLYAVWEQKGVVYIGGNAYIPHIYINGSWTKAIPHVYNSGWKKTKKEG